MVLVMPDYAKDIILYYLICHILNSNMIHELYSQMFIMVDGKMDLEYFNLKIIRTCLKHMGH
jgi:hypothetical protein